MSSNGQPTPGTPVTPEQLDALRDAAAAKPDPESGKALWRTLLSISEWFIIDKSEEGKPPKPHGMVIQDRRFLAIFSDRARAEGFASQLKGPEDGALRVRGAAPENLIRLAHSFTDQGIFGLQFNPGPHAFAAPLAMVVPVYAELKNMELTAAAKFLNGDEFEALALRVAMGRKAEDLQDILNRAAQLPAWFMLENPQSPNSPAIATLQDGRQALMVFTAEIHAARAAFAAKINKPDGSVDMIRTSIADGIKIMREAHAKGIPGAIFNIASAAGFPLDFAQLDRLAFNVA